MSKRNHIVGRASDVNGGQYIQTNHSYNSGYEDGKKAGKEYCASVIESLREQVEKLTKELSVLKTTPPHLRQDLHCVASDLSAQNEKLKDALRTVVDDSEECTDFDGWTAMLLSLDAYHIASTCLEETGIRARRNHG